MEVSYVFGGTPCIIQSLFDQSPTSRPQVSAARTAEERSWENLADWWFKIGKTIGKP